MVTSGYGKPSGAGRMVGDMTETEQTALEEINERLARWGLLVKRVLTAGTVMAVMIALNIGVRGVSR